MNVELTKQFLETCHEAKKVVELLLQLPEGMKPKHIQVIDTVHGLSMKKEYVRVSDVSETLRVTMPSITKLINELESLDIIVKNSIPFDKRIIVLKLTPLGERYYEIYVDKYHNWLAEQFADIDEEDLLITIQTISKAYRIMESHKKESEKFIL
ncbi:MAG: winged helix-turn-helix transcriptional regulator [Paenibacillaceae bacterium]|nr:winged helix-turn-helix transcriptional regulator [Paenibacillaceae bacterium]